MKILVYPHDLNMGGSQLNAIELAAAVSRLGHECLVFGRPGSLCSRIDELGLEFVESPDPGRRPSRRAVAALRELVRNRGIDIVHGYEWPPGMEAWLAAEGLPDVAAVCTVMSMAVAPFLPRWMPLVVGTQQISAREQRAGRLNVNLIEPPVDLEHNGPHVLAAGNSFRSDWDLDERPLVVCVSRLARELKSEGLHTAVEAAGALARSAPFQLAIVGDGRARDELQRAADRVNREIGRRTVVLTGELSDPRPAYDAADIMIGMGGSALRSLAFAKPLIVQGEQGYFRTLTPETVDEFRWQGWYGVGAGRETGSKTLADELGPLVADADRRRRLGEFSRQVVEDFSLERAAHRQLTIYRDAFEERADQKRRRLEGARSGALLARYYVGQRLDRLRHRQRSEDFNAEPVAVHAAEPRPASTPRADAAGPILYFPGVGWGALAGTDRNLAIALSRHREIVWVDTPHSVLRRRDRVVPAITRPHSNVVRLRVPVLAGVQRPLLRDLANRRRARVAQRFLESEGLRPSVIIASTTAPMLDLLEDTPGLRVYYATDDFPEAARMWDVSKRYLSTARERNLAAADLVLAVTPELARHLQRTPTVPRWLPNGADVARFSDIEAVPPADISLTPPVAGVVGQFNSRTDLDLLEAVSASGTSLLLVGPRSFANRAEEDAFERLVRLPGVYWAGELPRDELPAHLRALDVGLTPYADSMFNRRSYPLKTVEYLAAGLPVVSSAVAPICGLDPRFVSVESDTEAFSSRVAEVAHSERNPDEIRRSVRDTSWDARAARLLAWFPGEGRS